MGEKYIGGFFELAIDYSPNDSISSLWNLPENPEYGFQNARSALSALIEILDFELIWIPSYICTSVWDAVMVKTPSQVRFFPVNENLDPDADFLSSNVKSGDIVLAVNYFGRPPSSSFLQFAETSQARFIEDCAQTIDTGIEPWGDWRLFSPRKLMGVSDGGYIIAREKGTNTPKSQHKTHKSYTPWEAALKRRENPDDNSMWHAANQIHESSMRTGSESISGFTHIQLQCLDALSIIKTRKENFGTLARNLGHIAFLQDLEPSYCPSGFPITLQEEIRDQVRHRLILDGIFPAIHWTDLPSNPKQFSKAHQLSRKILTLPCDQRYDANDMNRISACVIKSMGNAI